MDVEGRFLDHADESGHTFRHDGIVGDACHAGQVPVEAELGKVGGKEDDLDGGNGGYTSGIIYLKKGEKIYVYVGGHGSDAVVGKDSTAGYNGGGLGTWDHSDDESAGARRRSNGH